MSLWKLSFRKEEGLLDSDSDSEDEEAVEICDDVVIVSRRDGLDIVDLDTLSCRSHVNTSGRHDRVVKAQDSFIAVTQNSVSRYSNAEIWLLHPVTGRTELELTGHQDAISGIEFLPPTEVSSSPRVVSVSIDGTCRFWDSDIGYTLRVLPQCWGPFACCKYFARHQDLFLGMLCEAGYRRMRGDRPRSQRFYECDVRVFDATQGNFKMRFLGHTGTVYNFASGLDRNLVYSCSHDATVKFWSLDSVECVCTIRKEEPCVEIISFEDKNRIAFSTPTHVSFIDVRKTKKPLKTFRTDSACRMTRVGASLVVSVGAGIISWSTGGRIVNRVSDALGRDVCFPSKRTWGRAYEQEKEDEMNRELFAVSILTDEEEEKWAVYCATRIRSASVGLDVGFSCLVFTSLLPLLE